MKTARVGILTVALMASAAFKAEAIINSVVTYPASTNTAVQFNDGGLFGGTTDFAYNKRTKTLSVPSMTATGFISGTFLGDGSRLTGLPNASGGEINSFVDSASPLAMTSMNVLSSQFNRTTQGSSATFALNPASVTLQGNAVNISTVASGAQATATTLANFVGSANSTMAALSNSTAGWQSSLQNLTTSFDVYTNTADQRMAGIGIVFSTDTSLKSASNTWTGSNLFVDSTTFVSSVTVKGGVLVLGTSDYTDGLSGIFLTAPPVDVNGGKNSPFVKFFTSGDSNPGQVISSFAIELGLDPVFPQSLKSTHLRLLNADGAEVFDFGQNGLAVKVAAYQGTNTNLLMVGITSMVVTREGYVGLGINNPATILDVGQGTVTARTINVTSSGSFASVFAGTISASVRPTVTSTPLATYVDLYFATTTLSSTLGNSSAAIFSALQSTGVSLSSLWASVFSTWTFIVSYENSANSTMTALISATTTLNANLIAYENSANSTMTAITNSTTSAAAASLAFQNSINSTMTAVSVATASLFSTEQTTAVALSKFQTSANSTMTALSVATAALQSGLNAAGIVFSSDTSRLSSTATYSSAQNFSSATFKTLSVGSMTATTSQITSTNGFVGGASTFTSITFADGSVATTAVTQAQLAAITDAQAAGVANLTYFPKSEKSGLLPQYQLLGSSPATGGEFAKTQAVSSSLGLVRISSHVTNLNDPGLTKLPAGVWDLTTWAKADVISGLTQIVVTVSTISYDGSVISEILSSTGVNLVGNSATRYDAAIVQQNDIFVSTSDGLLFTYSAMATSLVGINVAVLFGGTSHFTHIDTPVSGASKFVQLADTPKSLAGQQGKLVGVNNDQTSLVFVSSITNLTVNRQLTVSSLNVVSGQITSTNGFVGGASTFTTVTFGDGSVSTTAVRPPSSAGSGGLPLAANDTGYVSTYATQTITQSPTFGSSVSITGDGSSGQLVGITGTGAGFDLSLTNTDVSQVNSLQLINTGSSYLVLREGGITTGGTNFGQNNASAAQIFSNSNFVIGSLTANSMTLGANGSPMMYFDPGGVNIGIGTSNPINRLSVNGNIDVSSITANSGAGGWIAGSTISVRKGGSLIFPDGTSMNTAASGNSSVQNSTSPKTIFHSGGPVFQATSPLVAIDGLSGPLSLCSTFYALNLMAYTMIPSSVAVTKFQISKSTSTRGAFPFVNWGPQIHSSTGSTYGVALSTTLPFYPTESYALHIDSVPVSGLMPTTYGIVGDFWENRSGCP